MRTLLVFATGLLVGLAVPSAGAQDSRIAGMNLNHVMIRVENVAEASRYYQEKFGFKEAVALRAPDGTQGLTFLQVGRDTFIELMPSSVENPPGLDHIGLEVGDAKAAVAQFRQRGLEARDPNASRLTGSVLSGVQGTNGILFELLEFPQESLMRRAINAWK